jgi:hypothetical protein
MLCSELGGASIVLASVVPARVSKSSNAFPGSTHPTRPAISAAVLNRVDISFNMDEKRTRATEQWSTAKPLKGQRK